MPPRELTCRDCRQPFPFSERDQELWKEKGWNDPVRCRPCRNIAKQRRAQKDGGAAE